MFQGCEFHFTVTARECYEVMNREVTVTPGNGQENLVSVVMSSSEDSLKMDIDMQDDNKQGFVTEIIIEYTYAKSFSMEADDGTVLKAVCEMLLLYILAYMPFLWNRQTYADNDNSPGYLYS